MRRGVEPERDGAKAGDEKSISVTFPESYQAAHLAGREATFDVKVKEVARPDRTDVDDEVADNSPHAYVARIEEHLSATAALLAELRTQLDELEADGRL